MSILSNEQARRGMPTHLRTNGESVTHRPRSGSIVSLNGVFTEGAPQPLQDDRQGRRIVSTGSLLLGSTDVNGNAYELDDQGEFVIRNGRWAITKIDNPAGGTLVTLKLIDHKTIRHMPGNS